MNTSQHEVDFHCFFLFLIEGNGNYQELFWYEKILFLAKVIEFWNLKEKFESDEECLVKDMLVDNEGESNYITNYQESWSKIWLYITVPLSHWHSDKVFQY